MAKRSVKTKVALRITNGLLHVLLNVAFYCIVVFIILKACGAAYDFSYQLFGDVRVDTTNPIERQLVIEKDESTMSVASKLELYKIIDNKYSFYVRAKLTDENILPGTYVVRSDMNYDMILEEITTENSQDTTKKAGNSTSSQATSSKTVKNVDTKDSKDSNDNTDKE